jgi:adenylyltransferase/sulfurtransferase
MLAERRERYNRQAALPQVGWPGQERLAAATVVVVGCGGLGTVSAGLLARAGVGHLRLVDSNRVEFANLAGQVLFVEEDAQAERPKALAATERLRAANPTITVVKAFPKNQQRRLPHRRKPGVKARPAVFGIGTT